ncbi:hypothetical protein [Brevundimonas sp.]|uniref:hypothetical protein n=1 Tax=Brevundimonas sp. TaxID=1871086 RepID=UPI0025F07AB3|nr:hypothetical protein [Brevundimonas sp.]
MRTVLAVLTAGLLVSGCVTTGGDYPRVRYARAADAGPVAMSLAGRPTAEQMRDAEARWGRAIADAYACRVDAVAVSEAGMVGALELAAMSSASRGTQSPFDGVMGYLTVLGRNSGDRLRPDATRCNRLREWVGDVRREGREMLLRRGEEFLLPPS